MCPLATSPYNDREDGEIIEKENPPRFEELKLWLRGLINKPDYFIRRPLHDIDDLHKALYVAAVEIVQRMDPELEAIIHMAQEEDYNILLDEDEFYDSRKIDVDELRDMGLEGVKMFGRERTLFLLVLVRDEYEWLGNETRRLEVHCRNARELKQAKLRSSFEYRPTPRKSRSRPSNFRSFQNQNVTPPLRRDSTIAVKDEDEEMLDIVESVEGR